MRDIWKTSNELERQGSSKLIWFAPGHSEKPLVFTLCRGTQGKNKEGSLVSKDPFSLLIRKMQLPLWKVLFKDLNSTSITNLMKVHKRLWKQKHVLLSANISCMLTFPFCLYFECENMADLSQTIDVRPGSRGRAEKKRLTFLVLLLLCLPLAVFIYFFPFEMRGWRSFRGALRIHTRIKKLQKGRFYIVWLLVWHYTNCYPAAFSTFRGSIAHFPELKHTE